MVNTPSISTKQTITYHLSSLTYDVGNPAPFLGQAQRCGGVKPVNVIPNLSW